MRKTFLVVSVALDSEGSGAGGCWALEGWLTPLEWQGERAQGLPEGSPAWAGCWGAVSWVLGRGCPVLQLPPLMAGAVGVWLPGFSQQGKLASAVLGQDLLLPTTGVWGCRS